MNPAVIEGIEQAVEASPANHELRLHLAQLLVEAERQAEALVHCQAILAARPDHLDALRLAAQTARAVGEIERANSYQCLVNALAPAGQTAATLPTEGTDPAIEDPGEPGAHLVGYDEHHGDRADRDNVLPLRLVRGGGDEDETVVEVEPPRITLDDVAGMEEVKRRLQISFLAPMRNPEMRAMYGKSLRGGLMLYGPPGCGKTYIARATAGEMGARFIAVGLSDVLDMWVGASERNLHEIFETARRNAPCVLFFDEIEALGQKRSQTRNSPAVRGVVNQLLAETGNVGADNEGVFVLAATNHPWDVDTALRRPGRLDRTLLVLPPDELARRAIVEMNLAGRPVEKIDLDWIARKTSGLSGADLAHLVESAAERAMEDSLASGQVRPIRHQDFKKSLKEIRPSTRAWFDTARNYAQFANEGGVYDELLAYMREQQIL